MKVLAWVLLALLSGALGAEAVAWSGRGQRWLLRRAVAALPAAHRERYLEEWLAELEQLPNGPLTRAAWVLPIFLRRRSLARSLGAPASSALTTRVARGRDVLAAAGMLLALGPLLLALAVLIRVISPGPALYRQMRMGRDGRPFAMLKFRTMVKDAEARRPELLALNEADGPYLLLRRDPRVTTVGRSLRRFSLDELPQLLNIVQGHMSLIGPRPALPSEVAAYSDEERHRLDVRPGMTGLWQVSGRADLSWEESVRLDLEYVNKWSLWLDIKILARTVRTVLSGRGAY